MTPEEKINKHRNDARVKALDALSRYKFQMFGYWAAIWVHMNQIAAVKQPSPFSSLVQQAKILK